MKRIGGLGVAAFVLALGLSACNQPAEQQPAAAPALSADLAAQIVVAPFRGAVVSPDGNVVSVTRNGTGPQGAMITRVRGAASAVLVQFTAEGEGARLRVRPPGGGDHEYVRVQDANAVMVGPGGTDELLVFTRNGEALTVTISGVVDCATAPVGTCTPPVVAPTP